MNLRGIYFRITSIVGPSQRAFSSQQKGMKRPMLLMDHESWPDIQLGPLSSAHPKFPLPHNVGVAFHIIDSSSSSATASPSSSTVGANSSVNSSTGVLPEAVVDAVVAFVKTKLRVKGDLILKKNRPGPPREWAMEFQVKDSSSPSAATTTTARTESIARSSVAGGGGFKGLKRPISMENILPKSLPHRRFITLQNLIIGLNFFPYYESIPYPFYHISPLHDIDGYECVIQDSPLLLRQQFLSLFHLDNDFPSQRPLTVVTLRFLHPTTNKNDDNSAQICKEKFIDAAVRLCAEIKSHGHWADFVHPVWNRAFIAGHSIASKRADFLLQDFQKTTMFSEFCTKSYCDLIEKLPPNENGENTNNNNSTSYGFVGHLFCDLSSLSSLWQKEWLLPRSAFPATYSRNIVSVNEDDDGGAFDEEFSDVDLWSDEDW